MTHYAVLGDSGIARNLFWGIKLLNSRSDVIFTP